MPTRSRWLIAGLLFTGTLSLVAAAGLAAARLPAANHNDQLRYAIPAGRAQNALTLRVSGPDLVLLDGASQAVLASRPLAGTDGVTIQGQAGPVDDALTVDLSGGAPALPDGIHFDGGAGGYDTLVLTGGRAAPASYTVTGPQSGLVTHAGTRVFFSNLEPITVTAPGTTLIISATAGADAINIANGGSCGAGCQNTTVSSPSFESVTFRNQTNVIIKGLAGADTFNLNNSLPATGLNKLVLDAGGNPGDVIGIANFALPASSGTLSLTNVITVTQSGVISVTNLAVHAAGPVNLGNLSNKVTQIAGNTTGLFATFSFASAVPTLTVGSVEGIAGLTTNRGTVNLQADGADHTLLVSGAITTAGGNQTLFADHMNLNAALNAGAGSVYLDNETFPEPILLGTKAPGALGLLQTDLNQITAGSLRIGDFGTDTGGLTVTAPIAAPAGWSTLDLRQHASLHEASASISVANLVLRVQGGDVLFNNVGDHVTTLAGETTGDNFVYGDSGHFTIGTVAGVSGLSTAGGNIDLASNSGGLTVHQSVMAGAGSIQLFAVESASAADNLTIDPGVLVSSTNAQVLLVAGDHITLSPGSVVEASGAGNAAIDFSASDTDNVGGATIDGTLASPGHIPQAGGGNADETLLVDFQAGASLPNDLIYDGGGGLNGLTYTDAGSSSPHQYAAGTGMSRDLASLTHASRVQVMTVIGGSAADNIEILPDAGTTFHVVGGPPGHLPGDVLFVDLLLGATNPTLAVTSTDATGLSGQWTFGNRQPVIFSGIDSFFNLNHQVQLPVILR